MKQSGLKIKMCGLRRQEDIQYVNEANPEYVGFVFANSKRKVLPDQAATLISKLNPNIKKVGVFVNEDIDSLVLAVKTTGLDVIQLHGDENALYISQIKNALPEIEIWKAVRVKDEESIIFAESLPVDKLLLDAFSTDAYGGTGLTADLELIKSLKSKITKPFFMAGGLNIDNINSVAGTIQPFGIDISSGIETYGRKDKDKIEAVVELVRGIIDSE